jgi:hypothetical protein
MKRQWFKNAFGWGFVLWLIGYLLGILLFMFVPIKLIGWIVMPIGTVITIWVLFKKIKSDKLSYYLTLALSWTLIAVVSDYFFLVKMLKPQDGYYKLDVYIYYLLTFTLPILAGLFKTKQS